MNFEIVGVHPANKGAVLMLEAIVARLRREFPNAYFAVPEGWPVEARLEHGMWATPATIGGRPNMVTLFERAPRKLRRKLSFLRRDEIDVIIDASGFGYGDFWGLPKLSGRLTERLRRWKRGQRKAILLPQALGPFEKPGMAEAFRAALDLLDIAFVRDAASQAYVEAAAPGRTNIHRAPDFTNLLHPDLPSRLDHLRGRSVVIPNEKMVTGKGEAVRTAYLRFLAMATKRMQDASHRPFILVHEGEPDRRLAQELNEVLKVPLDVIDEPSALVTKAVIGVCALSVSSRFHGLVSGVAAAVPSLACGWSHKYRELMADYGCPDMVVDIDTPDSWEAKIDALIAAAADPAFRERLGAHAATEREKSEAMWKRVIATIR